MDLGRQIKVSLIALGIITPIIAFIFISYVLIGTFAKANIQVDAKRPVGPLKPVWRAIAQGGEQSGTRMLQPVTSQLRSLFPKYIRIDHIYDFYNVVSREPNGAISYDWSQLDQTVCDIYATGAKPFFALSYMPATLSKDGSVTSPPSNWDEWKMLVQKTIERYSGQSTLLCGGTIHGESLSGLYYEVWNEPDLDTFGKWSLYAANKNYLTLYEISSQGAQNAQNVQQFYLGGPATTGAYRNWFRVFLDFVDQKGLRVDFLSWHNYSKKIEDFSQDVQNIADWLPPDSYQKYRDLPKIITEWGYDPQYNPDADGAIGAAHTIAAIRNFIDENIEYAFSFEARDGDHPGLGILANDGTKKQRFEALKLLNTLEGDRITVNGESNYIKAIASKKDGTVRIVVANYDQTNRHGENVPLSISGLDPGTYELSVTSVGLQKMSLGQVKLNGEDLQRLIYLSPNQVALIEFTKVQ